MKGQADRDDLANAVQALLLDAEVSGELLALGLSLAYEGTLADEEKRRPRRDGSGIVWITPAEPDGVVREYNALRACAWRVWPSATFPEIMTHARHVLERDVPRFRPPGWDRHDQTPCLSMLDRNPTKRCTHPVARRAQLMHADGTFEAVGTCKQTGHVAHFEHMLSRGKDAWEAAGRPAPAYNTGGALRRAFESVGWEFNWDRLYGWASRGRYDPKATTAPRSRPHLTIVD